VTTGERKERRGFASMRPKSSVRSPAREGGLHTRRARRTSGRRTRPVTPAAKGGQVSRGGRRQAHRPVRDSAGGMEPEWHGG